MKTYTDPYQASFSTILASIGRIDVPAEVAVAIARLGHSTLDHLSKSQMVAEAKEAAACWDEDREMCKRIAASF